MINAKEAAGISVDAVHRLVDEAIKDIENNILSRCEGNYHHYNYTLPMKTPAVATEIRIYLKNLGYELKDVHYGGRLVYVHISWWPKKPKPPSYFSKLFKRR